MPETASAGRSRFFRLPSTSLGRVSAFLLLIAVVLMVLTSTVLDAVSLTVGNVGIRGMVNALTLFVALVTGAVALIRDRERSWAVWLSTALPAIVLGFEVVSLLIPGE